MTSLTQTPRQLVEPTPTLVDYAVSKIHTVVKRTCTDFQVNIVDRRAMVKLNALMRAKMVELTQRTKLFTENAGRTQPRVDDVLAAFETAHVKMDELIIFGKTCTGFESAWSRFQFPMSDRKTNQFEAMYDSKPSVHGLKFRAKNIPPFHRALHPEWIEKKSAEGHIEDSDDHGGRIRKASRAHLSMEGDSGDTEAKIGEGPDPRRGHRLCESQKSAAISRWNHWISGYGAAELWGYGVSRIPERLGDLYSSTACDDDNEDLVGCYGKWTSDENNDDLRGWASERTSYINHEF